MPVGLSLRNGGLRMKFGKFLKKAVKLGAKIAKPLLATTPIGALAIRAQQTLKSLGGNLKAARMGKIEPLSVRAPVEKILPHAAAQTLRRFPRSQASTAARTISRNFGAKARKRAKPFTIAQRQGSTMPQERRTATGKGKRTPPAGGLDLAAMAVQWRAAGKPGSWRDWIKSNQLRKPA